MDAKKELVEAATQLFAQHGYQGATAAKICAAAKTNIASINYHFGNKQGLFMDVLRHAFQAAEAEFPIDGGLAADAAPETRLAAFINAFIQRTFANGTAGSFNRIMGKVITDPHAPHEEVMDLARSLEIRHLEKILVDLLPGKRSRQELKLLVSHVMSGCVLFVFAEPLRRDLYPKGPSAKQLSALSQQVTAFTLAGLLEVAA